MWKQTWAGGVLYQMSVELRGNVRGAVSGEFQRLICCVIRVRHTAVLFSEIFVSDSDRRHMSELLVPAFVPLV